VAVYPVGVPVLFLVTLYFFKVPRLARSKTTMHRLKAVLKEVGLYQDNLFSPRRWDWTTEPVNLLDESQCKSVLRHHFRGSSESPESTGASIQARLWGQLGMANAAGDAQQEEDEADLEQLPLNELRRLTAGKVRDLCRRRLIVVPVVVWNGETGEAEKSAIEYCGVLFNTYRAEYWWFEIFDMLRKLVLSAMLPFVVLNTVRLTVGLVVSFSCLVVVFFTRPLVDASLDVLMILALITQTLTLLYGILLVQVEYTKEDASSRDRADLMIAEWIVYIINIAIFAIPIMHSVAQDTSSYLDEKSAGKYTSEKVPFQELPEGEVDPQDDEVGHRDVNTSGTRDYIARGDLVFSNGALSNNVGCSGLAVDPEVRAQETRQVSERAQRWFRTSDTQKKTETQKTENVVTL